MSYPATNSSAPPEWTGAAPERRVAYYVWRYPSLSETFIRRELAALRASGLDLLVLADRPAHEAELVEAADLPELPVRYLFPVAASAAARALIRAPTHPVRSFRTWSYLRRAQFGPDRSLTEAVRVFFKAHLLAGRLAALGVTHLHSPWGDMTALLAMLAARLAGTGFSVQFRAHDLHRVTSAFAVEDKIHRAAFVVTNSKYNETLLRERAASGDRAKIHRIYEGLDPTQFDASPRDRPAEKPFRILCVARLIEPKGLLSLLEACARLRDEGLDFECEVIGGPELPRYAVDHDQIRAAHRRLGLQDRFHLVGVRPFSFVRQRYRWADVFALPCRVGRDGSQDITPNGLIEAMACGLPVISTRMTAIPEIVEHGSSGLLVPAGDDDALTSALKSVMQDPELRRRLGRNARERVEQRFDMRRNGQEYLRLFLTAPAGD